MNPKKFLKNKSLRLLINVVVIFAYYVVFIEISWKLMLSGKVLDLTGPLGYEFFIIIEFLIFLIPIFFITRYIWFEKSRTRIFYGLFDKFKINFKKFEPRIYTTTSNADELKKYAELRDQGIITEEEFQSKKKKLLDL